MHQAKGSCDWLPLQRRRSAGPLPRAEGKKGEGRKQGFHTVLHSIPPIREGRPNELCFAALQVHGVQNRIFSCSLRLEKYVADAIYCSERYHFAPPTLGRLTL